MDCQRYLKKLFTIFEVLKLEPQYEEIVSSVDLIKGVLTDSKNKNVYVSFNGGKDATIALLLTYFAMKELDQPINIKCIYFEESQPFPEMDGFMKQIEELLNLTIYTLKSKKYQTELNTFNQQNPIDYIIMGSRRDDPGCANLTDIAQSDVHKGYPKFNRVNPIINWSYQFIWQFIRDFEIPYCKLYDEGYTSLGNKKNTKKNQALYDAETKTYKQAYLAPQEVERNCRKVKQQQH